LRVGKAKFAQHRFTVLVEVRRRTSGAARRPRKLDRGAKAAVGAEFGHHPPMRGMVGSHRLIDIEYRPGVREQIQ
jgi:hypothetical protein